MNGRRIVWYVWAITLLVELVGAYTLRAADRLINVTRYKVVSPANNSRYHYLPESGTFNRKRDPNPGEREMGELLVTGDGTQHVSRYWRLNPAIEDSYPHDGLVGKPTTERPLLRVYGLQEEKYWAADYNQHGKNERGTFVVASWQPHEITYNIRQDPKTNEAPLGHSCPVDAMLKSVDCPKWNREALLKALEASPIAKKITDLEPHADGNKAFARKLEPGEVAYLIDPNSGKADRFGFRWLHLVILDEHPLGIKAQYTHAVGEFFGGWTYLYPRRVEVVREPAPIPLASTALDMRSYADEKTEWINAAKEMKEK